MDIFDYLNERRAHCIRILRRMVDHYDKMENVKHIDQSHHAFDELMTYLKVEENLLYPKIIAKPQLKEALTYTHNLHGEMENILEKSVMIHVDEPSYEYRNNMEQLLVLLEKEDRYDRAELYPKAREVLTEKDYEDIDEHLGSAQDHVTTSDTLI